MSPQDLELLEKIRQQFDFGPYPRVPLETSPQDKFNQLFIHSIATPYYLRDQTVIDAVGKVILDAGCGSGYKSLVLAKANPGAKVVGIDLSTESVNLARQRLAYHGIENAEFHVLSITDLPTLGQQFDYINCDEVLYLFPDLAIGLQALKSVLKPRGMIRGNLHSALQRVSYFRAQELFKMMGLMDGNPEDLEIELAVATLNALNGNVDLKRQVWQGEQENQDRNERVLMNLLFQGDQGYTITDLFNGLRSADLEFVSMVDWPTWELSTLFQNPADLPPFWAMSLPDLTVEEHLHVFELMQPVHRLLDFWCGHPDQANPLHPVGNWERAEWEAAQVYLHPILQSAAMRSALVASINTQQPFRLSKALNASLGSGIEVTIDSALASHRLPLLEGAQPFMTLVNRGLMLRPFDPVTLQPTSEAQVFDQIKTLLTELDSYLYVLLER